MKKTIAVSLLRTVAVYVLGVVAGVQVSLYLWDRYDDGVADPLSGVIGVAFVVLGLGVALWPYLRR